MVARLSGARIRLPFALALLLVFGVACQKGTASDDDSSNGAAASDSSDVVAADADSSATSESSWKDRLFGGGNDEGDEDEKKEPAIPVETAEVARRDIPAFLASTATLEPEKQATILSKQSGQVLKLRAEEGDWVKKGQIIAELDGAEERVRLEEAAARATGLKLEYERVQSLHEREMASDKQLHDAEASFAESEANRKAMELQVAQNLVRAPFAGQLTERHVDVGQNVEVGAEIFSIVDRTPLLARIHLAEKEVRELEVGQSIWISRDESDASEHQGSVLRISPIVDTRTGTVKVTCQLENASAEMRPGSFVRVKVQTGIHQDVLAIPKRALVAEGADTYVYRAEADSVVKVMVETGFTDSDFVEVVEGLESGARIVTVGHGGLKQGSRIDDMTAEIEGRYGESDLTDTASREP